MFKRNKIKGKELGAPPIASSNEESVEVLRMWAVPGDKQQLTLRTSWKDPGAWGLALVDIMRHVVQAYERDGRNPHEVMSRIRELFDAELASPTDDPLDITDN